MLETRNLCKVYKPKKGVPVTALNKVSLKFGEKGMVFLLGKSGSGKSTLLNLLGGLDKYDAGEIIIKGVSSKDFKQSHFDSYRNTYVGFIFQEYNILEEFSVGANIALALELQGKKATDKEINDILKEVDLEGYGNRKPNELSGGQKQRVAIARALVKNPKIIMADEPTGALDSNTGRQVFETLKKLSKDKLVIIVSHDREFSELYADRIIELSDGNVISDVELDNGMNADGTSEYIDEVEEATIHYDGDVIEIDKGYHLTEEDRVAINLYIDELAKKGDNAKISLSRKKNIKFKPTNQDDIKMEDGSAFALIKSKLPMKNAIKIGASGLKHKKFRLVMTIILSCVAFGLFGLADTFASYNHAKTSAQSFVDTGINHLSLKEAKKYGSGIDTYWDSWGSSISKDELKTIENKLGVHFRGVVEPISHYLHFFDNFDSETEFTKTTCDIYARYFNGYAEITEDVLKELDFKLLAGTLPDGSKDEIAISKYVYKTFEKAKYADMSGYSEEDESFEPTYVEIKSYEDMIGKKLQLGEEGKEYVVTAVIDTNFDWDRYSFLMEEDEHRTTAEELVMYALEMECYMESNAGYNSVAMVGAGKLDEIIAAEPKKTEWTDGWVSMYCDGDYQIEPTYFAKLSDIPAEEITWLDGERTTLGEKEVIVDSNSIWFYTMEEPTIEELELDKQSFTFDMWSYYDDDEFNEKGYKVVGVIDINREGSIYSNTMVVNDSLYDKIIGDNKKGEYSYIVGPMPKEESEIREILEICYDEESEIQYHAQNAVSYELDTINTVLKVLAKVFMYIGIFFAIFASLMLANFIGQSISYKKQEIGILRAIGSRSNDVFRIFFSESFIIAMINFVLSATGVFALTVIINTLIRSNTGILVTVLSFGIRQFVLMFVISVGVAFLASFLPVKKIASKRPIDAIRNR